MERAEMELDEVLFEEEDEEFEITNTGGSAQADRFDEIVGRLEEIVMSDEFCALKDGFMDKYGHEFTDDEENKLIYMEIFNEYLATIENYIEAALSDVDMQEFSAMLQERHEEIDEALLEMLLSFTDFQVFKEMMTTTRGCSDLAISGASSVIHHDEMEEGDVRPDLDGITGMRIP